MILRKGSTGAGFVQQALLEAGYSIEAGELTSGTFGDSTYIAVRDFQAHHVDRTGHALVEDGIVGDETLYALMHPQGPAADVYRAPSWYFDRNQVREAVAPVLDAAVAQIGVHEEPDGSNRGPVVDQFTGFTGDGDGPPWCLYFVSWCFARAAGGAPFGTIGSAWGMFNWGQKQGRILSSSDYPQPGDVGLILRNDEHGHGFLLAADLGDGRWCTVEGNASNAVRGLVRPRSMLAAIVRPL